jgi:hypothetical protein
MIEDCSDCPDGRDIPELTEQEIDDLCYHYYSFNNQNIATRYPALNEEYMESNGWFPTEIGIYSVENEYFCYAKFIKCDLKSSCCSTKYLIENRYYIFSGYVQEIIDKFDYSSDEYVYTNNHRPTPSLDVINNTFNIPMDDLETSGVFMSTSVGSVKSLKRLSGSRSTLRRDTSSKSTLRRDTSSKSTLRASLSLNLDALEDLDKSDSFVESNMST